MEISLNTAYICPIGSLEKTLKSFKNAGFKCFDFSTSFLIEQCDVYIDKDDYKERTKHLRAYTDELGLKCNQSHSFMRYIAKDLSKEENEYRWMMMHRSIEMAAIMGAPYVVIHPFSTYSFEENVKYFKEVAKFAKLNNIKIAIENMPAGLFSEEEGVMKLLDAINDENVVFCLDIGHSYMPKEKNTTAVNMIRKCSKYLRCLHVHDNDKIDDLHALPGQGLIDFDEILTALKEINYQGDLTFEVDGYIYFNFATDKRDDALPSIFECGQKLVKRFEEK